MGTSKNAGGVGNAEESGGQAEEKERIWKRFYLNLRTKLYVKVLEQVPQRLKRWLDDIREVLFR